MALFANRVKVVKWFLIGSACFICSLSLVRGDAAQLYKEGSDAMAAQQYDVAAKAFDSIVTGYPTFQYIDEVRLSLGQAYLFSGKFAESIDRLSKELNSKTHPEYRPQALYYTALAQFSQGQKGSDKKSFADCAATMTTLIDTLKKAPSPDTMNMLESSYYYRALAYYSRDEYAKAETDLVTLSTSPDFAKSLTRPDYLLRLGNVYQILTNEAVAAKKPEGDIRALADKSLKAFDQVVNDPNALVQGNDANMSEGAVLYQIAGMDDGTSGYQKALEAFRRVHRKDDMVPIQQKRLADLRGQAQAIARDAAAHPGTKSTASQDISLLIDREQNRLNTLKSGADPIIQALIGIAECYVALKNSDSADAARTILHRLVAHATLTPEQQQTVDFQILYSYVMGQQNEQADAKLTDYLSKHNGDPNADSLSLQISQSLATRKDYEGALKQAQRSLKDFPSGKNAAAALALEADMLNRLGRRDEADKLINDYLKANPTSPVANQMLLTKGQSALSRGDYAGALAAFKQVMENKSASPELQAAAAASMIQTYNGQKNYDAVIAGAKDFEAKYADSKALPSVKLLAALALSAKKDPTAITLLQEIAKKYASDDLIAPFALMTIVNIYKTEKNDAGMIQAANELRQAYPNSYALIANANDNVSESLIKGKKYDAAIALYEPLTKAPKTDVAATASNKIASIKTTSAKDMGYYQSMQKEMRAEAEKRLASAEDAYLNTIKTFPDEINAVGDAFDGFVTLAKLRRSWGLLKDPDLEAYFNKLQSGVTDPNVQARFELAKAGLVFVSKKTNLAEYTSALDRFKKTTAANANLRLTRQEASQYGELLIAAKDYPTATKVFDDLLNNAAPGDNVTLGDAYYGLGATAVAQDDPAKIAKAKEYFTKLKEIAPGHPHISDANIGIALANEGSSNPADLNDAKQIYGALMLQGQALGNVVAAKSMIGYGRILEKTGYATKPVTAGSNDSALFYYGQPDRNFLGPTAPEPAAEGLYRAGQVYEKAGDKTNAKAQYDKLINDKNYPATAPGWVAKAKDAAAKL